MASPQRWHSAWLETVSRARAAAVLSAAAVASTLAPPLDKPFAARRFADRSLHVLAECQHLPAKYARKQRRRIFRRRLGRGFSGGFLGAGLFGLLFGHGLFGGMGGGSSILGLLIQIGLVFLVVKLALNFFRSRQQPGLAGAGSRRAMSPAAHPSRALAGKRSTAREKIQIQPADFNTFEQRLSEIETAFGQENFEALRHLMTPEVASYFSEQLADNASKGLVNRVGVPKLLQGDLAEAWREGGSEYATVAMHFQLTDWMVERSTGRIVSGDQNRPDDATEVWTFVRPAGGSPVDWKLSALQQA